jgi:hypothetical protein
MGTNGENVGTCIEIVARHAPSKLKVPGSNPGGVASNFNEIAFRIRTIPTNRGCCSHVEIPTHCGNQGGPRVRARTSARLDDIAAAASAATGAADSGGLCRVSCRGYRARLSTQPISTCWHRSRRINTHSRPSSSTSRPTNTNSSMSMRTCWVSLRASSPCEAIWTALRMVVQGVRGDLALPPGSGLRLLGTLM